MINKKYLTKRPKRYWIVLRMAMYGIFSYYVSSELLIQLLSISMLAVLELYFIAVWWTYPELKETAFVHRNLFFCFYSRTYKYSEIESLEITGSAYHYPLLAIKLKSKHLKRYHSIDCMSHHSINDFIKELQQKGVLVICK